MCRRALIPSWACKQRQKFLCLTTFMKYSHMKVSSTFYGLLCKKYKDVIILSFLKNTETIFVIYKIIENLYS